MAFLVLIMKFVADSMLGRLARWLRLLGFDVLYFRVIEDSELVRIALREGRVIITRDTLLVKRKAVTDFLLLHENDTFKQLKNFLLTYAPDVMSHKGLERLEVYARCSLCNNALEDIAREVAKEHVPEYVYRTQKYFRYCSGCGRYYWRGTHRRLLERKLLESMK